MTTKTEGVVIDWLGGNCPVQAEGTFDGVPFYFRARGTQVTVDVGEWEWRGPEYEWPEAGWVSEEVARAYINTAYEEWRRRDRPRHKLRRRNDTMEVVHQAYSWANRLEEALGADAEAASKWLCDYAHQLLEKHNKEAKKHNKGDK